MSRSGEEIEGLVLCRVGEHQIAFPATAVGHIEQWELGGVPAPQARKAFGLPPVSGKLLVHGGFSVVVDALEILSDRSKIMPVPAILNGAVGGALRGFVQPVGAPVPGGAAGQTAPAAYVVPVLGLAEFSTFVSTRRS